ncbi:NnrS family protein [Chelatococcus sp. SYSU_G07232]|uniref:NnrS family protein n=1 Tax=Chelatococcus albus TaxID=3047466 RepID=A0ABT7AFP6_9HYPH|nr:NnrS family protein [Chelatococcus sp. SYSU_G07232]MDJ1158207.1 NnrS family protein [Chelatococcus sp. SYSU_G07232]
MTSSIVIGPSRTAVLLNYAFRPFFLAAGLSAVALVGLWLAAWVGGADLPLPPSLWHAHEMLYGFAGAAIAGFLLTAVPNWTGCARLRGLPLAGLAGLWLAGRLALAPGSIVPPEVAALVDVAFLPALGVVLAVPLLRAGAWRNIAFLLLLGVLTLANAAVHLDRLGWAVGVGMTGIGLALDVVLLLVVVIGGRIVPAFTRNVLPPARADLWPISHPILERLAILSVVAMALGELVAPAALATGALAAFAAAVHGLRLALWKGWSAAGRPILWILHVGYLWVPVALGLKAVWLLSGAPWAAAWQHALTVGAFGTMILAVMSRASLGHSGRPLAVSRATVAAYLLVMVAAAARVTAPLAGTWYRETICLAGFAWVAGFLLFLAVYVPILLAPRVDGRE